MRSIMLIAAVLATLIAAPALAGPIQPLFNGDFEAFVPLAADAMRGTPVDGAGLGVGRQVLGCTRSANIIWEETCTGASTDRASEAGALAADPQSEVAAWTAAGAKDGDMAIIAPADQGMFYAAGWSIHPSRSIAFGDHNGDGDREAKILPGNQMLYHSFASGSPHTLLPAGMVQSVTADFETGAPAGSLVFVLDSFPLESAAAWPQAFVNYQLVMPKGMWSFENGVVSIDPLKGTLSNPAAGGWIVEDLDDHPTAAQWAAASPEERRAILMELRIVQLTFWNLAPGTVIDNVALDVVG